MKGYTDLEQSKKLAEILPTESADMFYPNRIDVEFQCALHIEYKHGNPLLSQEIPCWSLAALLDILESKFYFEEEDEEYWLYIEKCNAQWTIVYRDINNSSNTFDEEWSEELIDACFEMILKLKESNLL